MDHWLIGTFVLLVHDFTDLTLIFARGYRVISFIINLGLSSLFTENIADTLCIGFRVMDNLSDNNIFIFVHLRNESGDILCVIAQNGDSVACDI